MPVGICAFPYPMSEPEEEEEDDGMETFHIAPAPEPEAAKPPPPPSAFCPKYHPIHAPNVCECRNVGLGCGLLSRL